MQAMFIEIWYFNELNIPKTVYNSFESLVLYILLFAISTVFRIL